MPISRKESRAIPVPKDTGVGRMMWGKAETLAG